MKNIFIQLIFLAIIFAGCHKETDEIIVETDIDDPVVLVETHLKGRVVNESGEGIPNSFVSAGFESAVTNESGNFNIVSTEIKKSEGLISAALQGYFDGSTASNFSSGGSSYVEIVMVEKGIAETISSVQGGTVQNEGLILDVPAEGLEYENGDSFNGEALISSTFMDPTSNNMIEKMPGQLITTSEDGKDAVLNTFGVAALDISSESGDALELKEGKSATLQIPIPDQLLVDAPEELGLYIFDVTEQKWVLNGICTKSTNHYNCIVTGSGYYCVGEIISKTICLSATVLNFDGSPASFIKVVIEDLSTNFIYYGFTDKDGLICGSVPRNNPLRITVIDHCDNVVHSEEIGAFDTDVTLPVIQLDDIITEYMTHVSGSFSECGGTQMSQGHLAITIPGTIGIFPFTNGSIDFDLALKCIAFPSLEVQVFSESFQTMSTTVVINEFGDIELGAISTCLPYDDFFRVNIDGVDYWTAPTQFYEKENETSNWWILEGLTSHVRFQINLEDYQGLGTYDSAVSFEVFKTDASAIPAVRSSSPNISLEITSDDGEYIEGSFSGICFDELNQEKVISSSFRIKKAP